MLTLEKGKHYDFPPYSLWVVEPMPSDGEVGQLWHVRATKVQGEQANDSRDMVFKEVGANGLGQREATAWSHMKEIFHPRLLPIEFSWLLDESGNVIKPGDGKSVNSFAMLAPLMKTSLANRTQNRKVPIEVDSLLRYIRHVAEAIDFLNGAKHDVGEGKRSAIWHRDVKPANILLNAQDNAILADYGLVQPEFALRATLGHECAGSLPYMAPERLPPNGAASRTSDQYSLAITYAELRTISLPFQADDLTSRTSLEKAIRAHALDWTGIDPLEVDVLDKATSREPGDRYECAMDMVMGLYDAVATRKWQADRETQSREFEEKLKNAKRNSSISLTRQQLTAAGAALLGATLLLALIFALTGSGGDIEESVEALKVQTQDFENATLPAVAQMTGGMADLRGKVDADFAKITGIDERTLKIQRDLDTSGALSVKGALDKLATTQDDILGGVERIAFSAQVPVLRQRTFALPGNTSIDFVNIPAGTFLAGTAPNGKMDVAPEENAHWVKISKPFLLGATEVTQAQFLTFTKSSGYVPFCMRVETERKGVEPNAVADKVANGGEGLISKDGALTRVPNSVFDERYKWYYFGQEFSDLEGHCPVVNVTWHDAVAFCNWVTKETGYHCRLPTEAEWEYACRGRSDSAYYYGNSVDPDRAWFVQTTKKFYATGQNVKANQYGLYDMSGGVKEWCSDWYLENYGIVGDRLFLVGSGLFVDPTGPATPQESGEKALRGGGFLDDAARIRSASRIGGDPNKPMVDCGFRVLLDPTSMAAPEIIIGVGG